MEIILYITGGIALLAMAWLFISLAKSVSAIKPYLDEVRGDLAQMVTAVNEIKVEVLPILGNVNQITSNVSDITGNVQTQLLHVHETLDDALDIVRGTLDDVERLKDQVIATVEGPVSLMRDATGGAFGAILTGLKIVRRFTGKKKKRVFARHR